MIGWRVGIVAVLLGMATVTYAQPSKFTPPRLLKAELPPMPPPTIAGAGEVLIEAIVDRTGALGRPVILRGTPPYTQMVFDAMSTFRFEPARMAGPDGVEAAIDMPITIAGLFRPPVLSNTPTIGESPKDWSRPSGDAAYPISMEMPNYPPQVRDDGVVLLEVALNGAGGVTETRGVVSIGGFESASREALTKWRFTGAQYRARPVPTTAYVLFGFRTPTFLRPEQQPKVPPTSEPPFPPAFPPPPLPDFKPPPPADFKPPPAPDFGPPPPADYTPPPPPDFRPPPPPTP
jgi:hypothetical protein